MLFYIFTLKNYTFAQSENIKKMKQSLYNALPVDCFVPRNDDNN